jgi:hypothetical protein
VVKTKGNSTNPTCEQLLNDTFKKYSGEAANMARYGHINVVCPRYNRETEGGKTFLISAVKLWNSVPIDIRSNTTTGIFKNKYRKFFLE